MKKVQLTCMLAGLLLLLTSCGINLNTKFSADKNFKGTRVIRCSINKNDLTNLNRDFSSMDTLIEQYCPDVMSYRDHSTERKQIYHFTITFESFDDYKNKVQECLNFAPKIEFDYRNTPFANGLIYQENFTSRDLMAWFSENLIKEGFMTEEESEKIWNVEDALFSFDGSDYETDNQIDINTMSYLPLDSVSIYTNLKDGKYKQMIAFEIPSESLDLDSLGIEEYLKEKLDSGSFQWKWKGTKNGRQYRISYSADNLKELNALSKKALHGTSSLSCESSLDKKTPFQINDVYRQKGSLKAFQSSADGQVHYKIYFKTDQGSLDTKSETQSGRYQLLKEGYGTNFDLSFQVERAQTFSDYRITTVFHDHTKLTRELLLTGSYCYSENDIKLLSERLKKCGFQTVDCISYDKLLLSITGTPKEISSAYREFLLTDNPLSATTKRQEISRTQRSTVRDTIDLSGLSFEDHASGTYYFISNCIESMKDVSLKIDKKNASLKKMQALEKSSISDASSLTHFKGEYKAVITEGSILQFEYSGSVTDVYSSVLIISTGGVLLIALVIIVLYRRKGQIFHSKK